MNADFPHGQTFFPLVSIYLTYMNKKSTVQVGFNLSLVCVPLPYLRAYLRPYLSGFSS